MKKLKAFWKPAKAPQKPSEAAVLPEHHQCADSPLPRRVWGALPVLPFHRCPSCAHPLGMHDGLGPCQSCQIDNRLTMLESAVKAIEDQVAKIQGKS